MIVAVQLADVAGQRAAHRHPVHQLDALAAGELDQLVLNDVEATVATLQSALLDAKVDATALAGLYLVGGSSRMPVVADTIWRRLGVRPSVQDNPKSVVALSRLACRSRATSEPDTSSI